MKLTDLEAYEILEQCPLRDLKSEGFILRHKKSGARVAVISNDDDNKVFWLGNKRRALRKKTSQNIWQFKINPLPLHPLLKRSRI